MSLLLVNAIGLALKMALLLGAGALAAAYWKRPAASRHALWITVLIMALAAPVAALILPPLATIEAPWIAPSMATSIDQSARSAPPSLDWFVLLTIIWAAGASLVLALSIRAQISLSRWTRTAIPLRSPLWQATLSSLRARLPRWRKVRVLESMTVAGPCTWGVLRPTLLLPANGENWSENQRRDALIHELAHIERLDCLSALIVRMACATHWYNPLVWIAAGEALRLQEEACDDRVLEAGARPSAYASLLMALNVEPRLAAATGMANGSPMRRRLIALLDAAASRRETRRGSLLALFAAIIVGAFGLALASAGAPSIAQPIQAVPAIPAPPTPESAGATPVSPRTPSVRRAVAATASTHVLVTPANIAHLADVPPLAPLPAVTPVSPASPLSPLSPVQPLAALPSVPAQPALPPIPPT
ncbi:MAG: M56 family metallopeptidase [Vitreimonas sp.]